MTRVIVTAAESLEIIVNHGDEGDLVKLRGRLSIDTSPALRDQLLSMLGEPSAEPIVVDLAEVPYIDSSGIATLVEGLKVARNRQTTLCLRRMQGRLLHLFEITGLLSLFETNGCETALSASKNS